jgi:hypothetical protein
MPISYYLRSGGELFSYFPLESDTESLLPPDNELMVYHRANVVTLVNWETRCFLVQVTFLDKVGAMLGLPVVSPRQAEAERREPKEGRGRQRLRLQDWMIPPIQ